MANEMRRPMSAPRRWRVDVVYGASSMAGFVVQWLMLFIVALLISCAAINAWPFAASGQRATIEVPSPEEDAAPEAEPKLNATQDRVHVDQLRNYLRNGEGDVPREAAAINALIAAAPAGSLTAKAVTGALCTGAGDRAGRDAQAWYLDRLPAACGRMTHVLSGFPLVILLGAVLGALLTAVALAGLWFLFIRGVLASYFTREAYRFLYGCRHD